MSLRSGEEIFRYSLVIVRQHPRLLVFPLLVVAVVLAIVALVLLPALHISAADAWQNLLHPAAGQEAMRRLASAIWHPLQMPWLWLVGAWLTVMLMVTFINVAFYSQILSALNGGEVSVARGFTTAIARMPAIAPWALLTSTVGSIFSLVEKFTAGIGMIAMEVLSASIVVRRYGFIPALLGVPWTAMAQFAIPVMLRETRSSNPIEFVRISARMVQRVWGDALVIGLFGASGVGILTATGVVILSQLAGRVSHVDAITVWGALAGFVILCVTDGINGVYRCGLYIYATEGVAPGPFDAEVFSKAWTVR